MRPEGLILIILPLRSNRKTTGKKKLLQVNDRIDPSSLDPLNFTSLKTIQKSEVSNNIVIDIMEKESGCYIALFNDIHLLQPVLKPVITVALITTSIEAELRSIFINGVQHPEWELKPQSPEIFYRYFAYADRPQILSINETGNIEAISEGIYVNTRKIRSLNIV